MRLDYALYVLAALFLVTSLLFALLVADIFWIAPLVLGLLCLGVGYYARPKTVHGAARRHPRRLRDASDPHDQQAIRKAPEPEQETQSATPVSFQGNTAQSDAVAAPEKPANSALELTHVKGITPKRVEQLESFGINSLSQLAGASAEHLAKDLKIPRDMAEKWIADAKKLAA